MHTDTKTENEIRELGQLNRMYAYGNNAAKKVAIELTAQRHGPSAVAEMTNEIPDDENFGDC